MGKEKEMIEAICRLMPKSPAQLNKLFESDAEIVDRGHSRLALTIDEFSEEDLLRDREPYTLGWNIAVGCLSDILASGGDPVFYTHSLVVKKTWTKEYVEKMAGGIAAVLQKTGTAFLGGDFGVSETWRVTGSVLGEVTGQPLFRSGAKIGDRIFLSGKIGLGNVEAAFKLYQNNAMVRKIAGKFPNQFRLRLQEALLIREFSQCCIDTSDGVLNALRVISEQSGTGFEVGNLPYEKNGLILAKLLRIPKELLFCGECGEYELLFTVRKEAVEEFLSKAQARELAFYPLGIVKEPGCQLLCEAGKNIDFAFYELSARDYEDKKEYLHDVIQYIRKGGQNHEKSCHNGDRTGNGSGDR